MCFGHDDKPPPPLWAPAVHKHRPGVRARRPGETRSRGRAARALVFPEIKKRYVLGLHVFVVFPRMGETEGFFPASATR